VKKVPAARLVERQDAQLPDLPDELRVAMTEAQYRQAVWAMSALILSWLRHHQQD
jgi:hypothetical protein